ncbi:hypothetical protein OCU04_002535 [Sclerotinia nivalis]|uniref:Uncharacterized protein n=1 Tax=Sclerotinia nivalis TaxID=352851 RepID=A0A9X0ATU5_9HELO|nr:hypothetical protein OCU04_002535 [Sclerotinia nivalis]
MAPIRPKAKGKGKSNEASNSGSSAFKIAKTNFKDQSKKTQKDINRMEEIGREWASLAKNLPAEALPLVIERPSFVSMIETIEALAIGLIEAGRSVESKDRIKNGVARREAARAYSKKSFEAVSYTPSSSTSGRVYQRSGSVDSSGQEKSSFNLKHFVAEAKLYVRRYPFYAHNEGIARSVWGSFQHIDIRVVVGNVVGLLNEVLEIKNNNGARNSTLVGIDLSNMEIVTQSIRTSESNLIVASLQKSYLQMNLAILMDTAYYAHQAEDGKLNRTRHAEMLYRKWDEASQKAGNKKVNWSEEVRFGHRWMNWSETLLGESEDSESIPGLGALLPCFVGVHNSFWWLRCVIPKKKVE